jgi:hypothetical protein
VERADGDPFRLGVVGDHAEHRWSDRSSARAAIAQAANGRLPAKPSTKAEKVKESTSMAMTVRPASHW